MIDLKEKYLCQIYLMKKLYNLS